MVTDLRETAPPPATAATPGWRRIRSWPVLVGLVLLAGVALRLYSSSALWLDEAQSVSIARLPVDQLFAALRQDGSPPLYYLMLHGWIGLVGTGDEAVRGLSVIVSLAALPLAWTAGTRLTGRRSVGWAALLLLASSPFAIRYATETRMYALLVLLALLGVHAVLWLWRRPGPLPVLGVGVVAGLLALTHYWALYLLAAVGVGLLWYAVRPGPHRAPARRGLLGLLIGGVLFAPWVPDFLYQSAHTGTPWAPAAGWSDVVGTVSGWAGGTGLLMLIYWALAVLGVVGVAVSRHRLTLGLPARPAGLGVALSVFGTLVVAVVAGMIGHLAYSIRYSAVVVGPFLLLAALGADVLGTRARRVTLVVVAALGLATGAPAVWAERGPSDQVADALRGELAPGDLVVYCPDQLGPPTARLLPARVDQVVYPTAGPPQRVDWVDYRQRNRAADPALFAGAVDLRVGRGSTIWLVYANNYRTFGDDCAELRQLLTVARPGATTALTAHGGGAERVRVVRFPPR